MQDPHMMHDIFLTITSDSDQYRQQIESVIKNLQRKIKAGKYDADKAVVLWGYVADNGVRRYSVDQCGHKIQTLTIMSKSDRRRLARQLMEYYDDQVFYEVWQ